MEQIDPRILLVKIIKVLDSLKISYWVTGGIAVLVWGSPRFTADVDIVIQISQSEINSLGKMLKGVSKFGYFDEQMATEAVRISGEFNFIDPETGVKFDFWVAPQNERSAREFSRRIAKKIDSGQVYFISPEDLILNKLLWYQQGQSAKHLEDIRSVLRISGDKLDPDYLNEESKRLGVDKILKDVKRKITKF